MKWLRERDRGLVALRRAARTALVMPAMFALGTEVIGNPALATFAAFGSFAMLLLVDFTGPMRARLQAQAALAVTGAAFVCGGTLVSNSAWLAAVCMGFVAFGVLFAGVVSSVLASATTSLLLAFILPVSLPGPVSSIPDRIAGWGLASGAALAAVGLLWPAPTRDPVRSAAIAGCRAMATRLRVQVAYVLGGESGPSETERDTAITRADEAVEALHAVFFATPYRPTGLSTAARAVVRLVDELRWLNTIVLGAAPHAPGMRVDPDVVAVKRAAALVLERGADLLDAGERSPDALHRALDDLRTNLRELERGAALKLPVAAVGDGEVPAAQPMGDVISSLDPSFRAQELSFVVWQIAANIDFAAAERRTWLEQLLGRQPAGLPGPLSAAHERAGSHVERHSVWFQNSVRGAVGLGVAVLIANLSGVQHAFWVVLGTLSVLRSNALSTGENVLRGLLGTVAGFAVGAALVVLIGTNMTLLWFLLPAAVLFAGLAPAVISFAAGQAAFTITLLILFNILAPEGWEIGLVRIEDVALGSAVSLAVGLLFWPRGAGAAFGEALARAYADSAIYLAAAVRFGLGRCDSAEVPAPPATDEATRAAAAARRLDDTFRGYLAERGAKPVPLAEVTTLVTGVVGLRLAGDAVLDLWQLDDDPVGGDRAAARGELHASAERMAGWYSDFAASLAGTGDVPEPLNHDGAADQRLVEAVGHDLSGEDGRATATAVRMIWTGDHLDAARRLQAMLAAPARTAVLEHALT